jgi:hypothetical protein
VKRAFGQGYHDRYILHYPVVSRFYSLNSIHATT